MSATEYLAWIMAEGQMVVPLALVNNRQALNLSPENLGYLLMAMADSQRPLPVKELAQNPWLKWSLTEGWANWEGKGEARKISFGPLWQKLYTLWSAQNKETDLSMAVTPPSEVLFDCQKIIQWLDQVRGTLSITLQEKKVLQEFNLQYGWSSDFVLIFLQLCFAKGQNTVAKYQPLARKVFGQGIHTVEDLVSFMNELDWVRYKVGEVKKCVGQYGGITQPQREMYLKWCNLWQFGHEVIMRAAEETVRTNSPSFKYIDGILGDWYQKGVKNIADAEKVLAEFTQKRKRSSEKQNSKRDLAKRRISRVDNRDWEKMLGIE